MADSGKNDARVPSFVRPESKKQRNEQQNTNSRSFGSASETPGTGSKNPEAMSEPHSTVPTSLNVRSSSPETSQSPVARSKVEGQTSGSPDVILKTPSINSESRGTKPKTVVARSKSLNLNSKPARSKTPDTKSKAPTKRSKITTANFITPVASSETPAAKSKSPDSDPNPQAARSKTPDAVSNPSTARSKTPDAVSNPQVAGSKTLDAVSNPSTARSKTPDVVSSPSTARSKTPDAVSNRSTPRSKTPDTVSSPSTARSKTPVVISNIPVAKSKTPDKSFSPKAVKSRRSKDPPPAKSKTRDRRPKARTAGHRSPRVKSEVQDTNSQSQGESSCRQATSTRLPASNSSHPTENLLSTQALKRIAPHVSKWKSVVLARKGHIAEISLPNISGTHDTVQIVDVDTDALEQEMEMSDRKDDPFGLVDLDTGLRDRTLGTWRCLQTTINAVVVLIIMYIMTCALHMMAMGLTLIGRATMDQLVRDKQVMSSYLGIFGTGFIMSAFLQSCPYVVLLVLTMVLKDALPGQHGAFMVMGADFGSSWTTTWITMTISCDRQKLKRAFAGSTLTDMFNWLKVLVVFPIEATTGLFYRTSLLLTYAIVGTTPDSTRETERLKLQYSGFPCSRHSFFLKEFELPLFVRKIIEPVTGLLIKIRKLPLNVDNMTFYDDRSSLIASGDGFSFSGWAFSDSWAGVMLLVLTTLLLLSCTVMVTKVLKDMLLDPNVRTACRFFNGDLCCRRRGVLWRELRYQTGWLVLLLSLGLAVVLERGILVTALMTPVLGVGMLTVYRMYPIALGAQLSNAVLTYYMVARSYQAHDCPRTLAIAVFHLMYAGAATALWFLVPWIRQTPVHAAKVLGQAASRHRYLPAFHLIGLFCLAPALCVTIARLDPWLQGLLASLLFLLVVAVIVINVLQAKMAMRLPQSMRTWKAMGVPSMLLTLDPYDRAFRSLQTAGSRVGSLVASQNFHKRLGPLGLRMRQGMSHVMGRIRVVEVLKTHGGAVAPEESAGTSCDSRDLELTRPRTTMPKVPWQSSRRGASQTPPQGVSQNTSPGLSHSPPENGTQSSTHSWDESPSMSQSNRP